jgi:hypothetical protein
MASDSKDFKQDISADPTNFLAGWQKAVAGAASGADAMKSSIGKIGDAFSAVQKPLLIISAMLSGGAFFKDAIGAANKLNGESMSLAKSLGISGTQASMLNTALGDIGSDSETYIGAFQKFAKQLKSNEDGLQAMGLKTRDANGNLRDSETLFTEAIAKVGGYKAGLDQTTAAQTLFGKGVNEVMTLQKLDNKVKEEARQKNEELGLTITKEGVESSKKYKMALNDVGDVFTAIKNQIGLAVMPILTELGNWFAEIGPAAVFIFKTAIDVVATVLRSLVGVVRAVGDIIVGLMNPIMKVSSAIKKMIQGDWQGAAAEDNVFAGWGAAVAKSWGAAGEDLKRTGTDVANLWKHGTEVANPSKGTETMGNFGKTNGGAKTAVPSRMAEWEAQLATTKAALEKQGMLEGQYREMSLSDQLKYWNDLKNQQGLSDAERIALSRKAAELEMAGVKNNFDVKVATLQAEAAAFRNNTEERMRIELEIQSKYQAGTTQYAESAKRLVAIQRQAADQENTIKASRVQATRDAQLQTIDIEEQAVQTAAQLGLVTNAQVLEQQAAFEVRRNAIAAAAIQERLQIALLDKDKNPVEIEKINTELEALERAHQLRLGQIRGAQAVEQSKYQTQFFGDMQQGMQTSIKNVLTGTQTLSAGFKSLFASMGQSLASIAAQMVATWAMAQMKMRLSSKQTALAELNNDAVAAGGAAYKAVVGTPFIGPFLAPAAAAVAYAGVMAFGASASAAGGYDIPGNINPIVQAHAREMILPAKHADVIRNLADQAGGQGGGANTVVMNITTPDADSFRRSQRQIERAQALAFSR